MKLAKFFIAVGSALFIAALCACNDESEVVPEIAPAKKTEAKQVQAAKQAVAEKEASMPTLQSIESLSADSVLPNGTFTLDKPDSAQPGKEGQITIQVSIQPSKRNAQAILKQLESKGIRAYLAQVENPGELEGTYYRVRVGYFKTTDAARNFGKSSLEPLGFAWWTDNRANDKVGSPEPAESSNSYNHSDSYNNSGAYTESAEAVPEEPATEESPAPQTEASPSETAEMPAQEPQPEQPAAEQAPAVEADSAQAGAQEPPAANEAAPAAQEQAPASEEVYDDWESF